MRSSRSASRAALPLETGKRAAVDEMVAPKKKRKCTVAIVDQSPSKDIVLEKKVSKSASKDIKSPVKSASKDIKQPVKKASKDIAASPSKEAAKKQAVKGEELKKLTMKGKVPVDEHFQGKGGKVLEEGGIIYACTLNQSNIQSNNNKFYKIQIVQSDDDPNHFTFFTRWGRVGVVGQMTQYTIAKIYAINTYHKKKREKINGGYIEVEMNYEDDKEEKEKKEEKGTKEVKKEEQTIQSTLPLKVQELIRLIFDMRMMNEHLKEIGYDAKKMPLGKLAKSSILKGYEALKSLMQQLKKTKKNDSAIAQYSSNFYSFIPHDFGFQNMRYFNLDTEKKVKDKLQMLQSLQDIQIYTKLLDEGKISSDMNQLDSNYLKLNTQITPLDPSSDLYKMLVKYVRNTCASTHQSYNLVVEQIFSLSKEEENKRYTASIGNKMLLWHGSRLTNYVGILSQGLRIAPPQAPVTGYMFGKGVYFADMVTKSANYCCTNRDNNIGLMLLCEVALGEPNKKPYADYYANLLPQGKKSTQGVGKTQPNDKECQWLGEVKVPCGTAVSSGVSNCALLYNQFIVYDIAQIKTKFLFKMKFDYR